MVSSPQLCAPQDADALIQNAFVISLHPSWQSTFTLLGGQLTSTPPTSQCLSFLMVNLQPS